MVKREQVIEVLKTVKDPEILQSVCDLGLIYDVTSDPDGVVKIVMTMTTPFCPYAPALIDDVKKSVRENISGVIDVQVEVVWDPPWSLDKVSPEIKAELGIIA